ncbi:hypothetical protein GA0070616_1209 [Micromonospora nigra]|uniref:Uncharacterized protein n=1 Tax=Micromonospora nigra TaxID=145857 RepID=A0A1C6RIZ5_9ACTN|nr:hypothetical protein GA0070616_1209 [Micromonospora nigra]
MGPVRRPAREKVRTGVEVGGDDAGPAPGAGADGRGWQAGAVGVPTLPPPHPAGRTTARPTGGHQETGSAVRRKATWLRRQETGSAVRRRGGSAWAAVEAGRGTVSSGWPGPAGRRGGPAARGTGWCVGAPVGGGWWCGGEPCGSPDVRSSGAAGESRSGRTGDRPARAIRAVAARMARPVRRRPRPDRGAQPRTVPRRSASGVAQAATVASAGSTSVHEEPRSAERVTASSTSWTCNASANEGVGSAPVATASMKSRI